MAELNEKLLKVEALKKLGQKVHDDYATKTEVQQQIQEAQSSAPKKVSDLENDSNFQTETQVSEAIKTAISKTGHASFKVVEELPEYAQAEDNVLYLLKNSKTQKYDIYAKVEGSDNLELLDDVSVDLSEYSTTAQMNAELEKKADKEHTHEYAGASTSGGSATSAEKLDTDTAGSASQPVYFKDGKPVEVSHSLNADVPAGAVFADASAAEHGYMAASDKQKLDGMEIASDDEIDQIITGIFSPAA